MKTVVLSLFVIILIGGGINHILNPKFYKHFIPSGLPKLLVNYMSGVVEIALAVGLLFDATRYWSAIGIFILMIAFLPLHVHDLYREKPAIGSRTLAIIRLPIQFLLIWAAWWLITDERIAIANKFIDTFYSFNTESLKGILSDAPASHGNILYYQKWAECANYKVVNRGAFVYKNDSTVLCPITVKDDLMGALKIDFNVTDTFHVTIREGRIRFVESSSNDLEVYYEAKEWVKKNRPGYVETQCIDAWNGGPTPCECVQEMIKGFGEFVKVKS